MPLTDSPTQPSFSIVVPTRGRPASLELCLRAIQRLRYPRDLFEVVVVDDGSPEPVEPVIRSRQDGPPQGESGEAPGAVRLRFVRQPATGPGAARNAGVRIARGRYIAFTDDDCRPRPDWLHGFALALAENPDRLLGGRTVNALPDNPYSSASQHLIDYLYEYFDGSPGRNHFFTTSNMAVPRSRFMELGGFDPRFRLAAGEDRELCDRWNERWDAAYVPDAVVEHSHDLSFRGFLRQHFTYGRGAAAYRDARQDRGLGGPRREPASFYAGLVRYPLARGTGPRRWLETALITATQAANAAGFWRERFNR